MNGIFHFHINRAGSIKIGENTRPTHTDPKETMDKENFPWTQPSFQPSRLLDLTKYDLGPEGSTELAEFLRRDTCVESLDLTQAKLIGEGYNDKGVEALMVAFGVNRKLKSVKLFGNELQDESVGHIAKALLANDSISSLNLGYNNFTARGVQALAEAAMGSESLMNFQVGAGTIRVQEVKGHVKSKKSGVLNFRNQTVGPLSALVIARLLRMNKICTSIDLSHNSLRKEGTAALCDAMSAMTQLKEVNISSNEIFPDGGETMARLVATSLNLEVLKLAENNITNWGQFCAPLENIVHNALEKGVLRVLHLQGNVLRDTGAAVIAKLVQDSTSLTEVDVSRSQLGPDGAMELARALSSGNKQSSLKKLKLDENGIGSRGSTPIIEAICTSGHQLTTLSLRKNVIPEATVLGWLDILSNNRDEWALEEIDLEGNRIPHSLIDDFSELPKKKPNRYGIVTGADRIAPLKAFRLNYENQKNGTGPYAPVEDDVSMASSSPPSSPPRKKSLDIDVATAQSCSDDDTGPVDSLVSPLATGSTAAREWVAAQHEPATSNSPQSSDNKHFGDEDTYSDSDEEDLSPAMLAAMQQAYNSMGGGDPSDVSETNKVTDVPVENTTAEVIQSIGGSAWTGTKPLVQGLAPRRRGSKSKSALDMSGMQAASEAPPAPISPRSGPPTAPKPDNLGGRMSLLRVHDGNDESTLQERPKLKARKTAEELRKHREEQEAAYKRQEDVAKSYEMYKAQKAARAAKK